MAIITADTRSSTPLAAQGLFDISTEETFARPRLAGKFLAVGAEKLYIKGVTYGTFRPDPSTGGDFDPWTVDRDFAQMAGAGINAVRVYTTPPRWLLDAALKHGIYVMVGLPWEQHITFLDDPKRTRDIEKMVYEAARACAGHPAVLCYAIGNEIPAPIVRWEGARKIEKFLERLYRAVKRADPDGLVTYVNYPTSEYLELPWLDIVAFNVYLDSLDRLDAYLAKLQNIAGDRPLLLAEVGLDSRTHGEDGQAHALHSQIRTSFAAGCAGTFVFSWTDEWHRGGFDVDDWDFGIVDRNRNAKPALAAVNDAYAEVPFPSDVEWPRVSVVVCSYNGEETIRDCLDGLCALDYPSFEVIVVDDGSKDNTAEIARGYGFRVIGTENQGLSSARNTGLGAATGEIVAYIDDDAWPDPQWLKYLAHAFLCGGYAAVGGPNIPPPGDGLIAECVADAPGGPIHVLLSDTEAEHIPGCNLAVRANELRAIGGFDPIFRAAGDDVDVCWRLRDRGGKLGFSHPAMVWHHRRNSILGYLKQQMGYGRAEALLERKWPEKYNSAGHLAWVGRVYQDGRVHDPLAMRGRIYRGVWGQAPFQSVYQPHPSYLAVAISMPEWYFAILLFGALGMLGLSWPPLLTAIPVCFAALGAVVFQSAYGTRRACVAAISLAHAGLRHHLLTFLLHILQPLARLRGRLGYGLTPWRKRMGGRARPWPRTVSVWSEHWRDAWDWIGEVYRGASAHGARVLSGGPFDPWDLEVRPGMFGAARLRMAVEEHGGGRQMARFRVWPVVRKRGVVFTALFLLLGVAAAVDGAWSVAIVLQIIPAVIVIRIVEETGSGISALEDAVRIGVGPTQIQESQSDVESEHPESVAS